MAIINFDFTHGEATMLSGADWPEGAYCPLSHKPLAGGGRIVLWTTHHGLCLYDYERNGYDDSDFLMVVWNPQEQKPETIWFASTRGWSYPAYDSKPDATPEVVAAYEAWKERKQQEAAKAKRHEKAKALLEQRAIERKVREQHGITWAAMQAWKKAECPQRWGRVLALLASTRLRSKFRISLRDRAVQWLKDQDRQYNSPYSHRQWEYV